MSELYDDSFYKDRHRKTEYAAKIILKRIFEIIPQPTSMVDIGCGVGTWLYIAKTYHNVGVVRGYDGDYVPPKYIKIASDEFCPVNIEKLSFDGGERFDLAISLEVAEHLDEKYADKFVNNLCRISDNVLFSAGVPYQGGFGHINEQPLSYWKAKFEAEGFKFYDAVRPFVWNDPKIPVWYRQNVVLFSKLDFPKLKEVPTEQVDIIHPEILKRHMENYEKYGKTFPLPFPE